ncbi:hypothetical protein CAPTEDRAFT_202541 [Capitella teleta]|uniref:Uncharacterized protein n=1 Tax=Capitella teleta TaxID=283909 RepID=R7V5Y8_CAPTE|nr:hypothetical protein CAPTEDRAFT_202541 [Capitella teleta]|eukprot:ELU13897.1 hypothetical protein CAPTEDRAFT_202541 [Capitella teleta]
MPGCKRKEIMHSEYRGLETMGSVMFTKLYSHLKFALLILFLYSALNVTVLSCFLFTLLLVAVLFTPKNSIEITAKEIDLSKNPLKRNPIHDVVPPEVMADAANAVMNFCVHDAANSPVLLNFEPLKAQSQCLFARKAKLWGSRVWKNDRSLGENTFRNLATLVQFTVVAPSIGLQGFLFELPENFGSSLQIFSNAVLHVLSTISSYDPTGVNCMADPNIETPKWVFQFNKVTFFVTSFAPFYPPSHPRHSFGCKFCYILLQPEFSFAQLDIPFDTPETQWDNPKSVRDRTRVAFRDAGRPYHVRDTVSYPMVHDVVRGMNDHEVVRWWKVES